MNIFLCDVIAPDVTFQVGPYFTWGITGLLVGAAIGAGIAVYQGWKKGQLS